MASGSSASTTWIIFLGWPKPCCSSHVWIKSNIRWSLWVSMPFMSGRMVQQKNARMIGRIRIARRDPSVKTWKPSEKWFWEQKSNRDHSCNNRWIVILILPAIQHTNCDCEYRQFIQLKLYGGSVRIPLEKEHHHVHKLDCGFYPSERATPLNSTSHFPARNPIKVGSCEKMTFSETKTKVPKLQSKILRELCRTKITKTPPKLQVTSHHCIHCTL